MPVITNINVSYKPDAQNYEVVIAEPPPTLRFRVLESDLVRFVKDLHQKEECVLKGIDTRKNPRLLREDIGEFSIKGGLRNPQRKQVSEYIELVLESKRNEFDR